MVRYRFGPFTLSPRRRVLVRDGREVPLIPRYFDLLVLLVERRHEAVHRREIMDRVWSDVIVSDSALSQAIRTIRRTLEDDPREPQFIRTVSRHGYRFVFPDVVEESDNGTWPVGAAAPAPAAAPPSVAENPESRADDPPADPFEPLLERLTRDPASGGDDEDRREAAEVLHALGTEEALRRLGTRPRHALARAVLRDSRWDVATAGRVPIVGAPAPLAVAHELIRLRLRRAARIAAGRCAGASLGGGVAGLCAGGIGGLLLAAAPGSTATVAIAPVLAAVGGACGAIGGAGVGAGLSVAEASARSGRPLALIAGASLGGGLVGWFVQWMARWSLSALVGLTIHVGGGLEGLVIGAAAGAGYALATRTVGAGMAAPRGRRRLRAAIVTALICGLGGLVLSLGGRVLVGGTIHAIARAAEGSQATLAPLGRLIGEPDFGPISRAVIAFGESAIFGLGLALGLTRRPAAAAAADNSGVPPA